MSRTVKKVQVKIVEYFLLCVVFQNPVFVLRFQTNTFLNSIYLCSTSKIAGTSSAGVLPSNQRVFIYGNTRPEAKPLQGRLVEVVI